MCIATPAKVISIIGKKAVVEQNKEKREVIIAEPSVKVGDTVVVQMGIIVEKVE